MRLLWFVSTLEDTLFLKEFSKYCEFKIDVFNLNFITWFDLRGFQGIKIIPKYYPSDSQITIDDDLHKVFNVLSGRLSLDDANRAYKITKGRLADYIKSIKGEKVTFIIPSGRHVHHVAATRFAKIQHIERVYINYSNFPGFTFFDPEGTDCLASIYKTPSKLEKLYAGNNIDIDEIFKHFADVKSQQKTIPQKTSGNLRASIKKLAFFIDTSLQYMTNVIGDRRVSFRNSKKHVTEMLDYSSLDCSKPFLFFPLQVSTDQQVLVNYEGGSIYVAIDQAYEYAKSKGLPLYVREHPAEANKIPVRTYLKKLAINEDFYVTDAPVSDLISSCLEVITINSTVGLESRINRKPVHFLGKSFYEKATDLQLAYYLKYYLISVDYHNPIMNKQRYDEIMSRCTI